MQLQITNIYMFGPHRGLLSIFTKHNSETHIIKRIVMKHSKDLTGDLRTQENHIQNHDDSFTDIDRQTSDAETDCEGSHHLV